MHQTDKFALTRAAQAGEKAANEFHYRNMRNPLTASQYGVRPWPEVLTAETVASWIVANVGYATPWEAHAILNALVAENNA
jgi:hypothetical protein